MTKLRKIYETIIESAHQSDKGKGTHLDISPKQLKLLLNELIQECIKAGKKLK